MNGRILISTGCFIAMISSAAVAGGTQSYFRKIVLLGRAERIEGRYAMSGSAWSDAKVYRFSYDDNKRLERIDYFVGGEPHPDPVFGVERIAFSYSDGREERSFENSEGIVVPNSMRVCSQIIELDSAGRTTSVLNHDASGNLCEDEFGIAESRFMRSERPDTVLSTFFGKGGGMVRVEIDIFDNSRNMTEVEFRATEPDTNNDIPWIVRYAYDDSGDLTSEEIFGKGGGPIRIGPDSWKYDPVGEFCTWPSSYEIRNIRTQWKYDSHGNITEEEDFGSRGELTTKAVYAYDGSDRILKLAYFDSAGTITEAVGDWGQGSDVPPPDFYPLDKEPQVISDPVPVYPELAQRAGIEGRVLLKIWVDKEGNSHRVLVLKSDAEIFNHSAMDAAMSAKFKPAILNGEPEPVWVVIPYTFKLK